MDFNITEALIKILKNWTSDKELNSLFDLKKD